MPYLRGTTLHEWMKKHPDPFQNELEAIFVPLLEGLKYIHDRNLLHRDIKPENIYILENNHPILIDFGSARIAIGEKSKALTQVLTPHFAPWEQYRSKGTFTPALDLYSLAACMYQAITGKLPEEAPERIEEDLQPKLVGSEHEKWYSLNFLRAIDKSLSVHARDRHQDGFNLQKDLVKISDEDIEIFHKSDAGHNNSNIAGIDKSDDSFYEFAKIIDKYIDKKHWNLALENINLAKQKFSNNEYLQNKYETVRKSLHEIYILRMEALKKINEKNYDRAQHFLNRIIDMSPYEKDARDLLKHVTIKSVLRKILVPVFVVITFIATIFLFDA